MKKSKTQVTFEDNEVSIFDEEDLNRRKMIREKQAQTKPTVTQKVEKPKQWWELPISEDDLNIVEHKGKWYAQHKEWNKNIWIGEYSSKKELDKVISDYIANSKKPIQERTTVKNLHSIVKEISN